MSRQPGHDSRWDFNCRAEEGSRNLVSGALLQCPRSAADGPDQPRRAAAQAGGRDRLMVMLITFMSYYGWLDS